MTPEDPRHGMKAGYDAHRRAGITPCSPCRDAVARYQRGLEWDLLNGRSRRMSATGTLRRLQSLVALGWTMSQIADAMGVHRENLRKQLISQPPTYVRVTTAVRAAEVFESWSMRIPEQNCYATRARNLARREGWVVPLAWADIDNPDCEPRGVTPKPSMPDDYDEVVVERILAGDNIPSTRAERDEVVRRWIAAGNSEKSLCDRMGWKAGRYAREESVA